MSGITTKAKVNLKEGTIELEGSEAFVSKYLETLQEQLKSTKLPTDTGHGDEPTPTTTNSDNDLNKNKPPQEKTLPKKKVSKIPQSVAPIPIDLTAKGGNPSLKDFFKEKKPRNDMENTAVFAYFLKYYLSISDMKIGHVVSCFQEVNQPVPTNILSTFKNIQHRKGWLEIGTGGESAKITIKGENFVKYELPKKDVTKDKESA